MKLFCFLLTLVIVNVSAEDDAYTKLSKEIYLTNIAIKKAFETYDNEKNGLEYVIEKMVDDAPTLVSDLQNYYSCFAKINYMIALPVNTDICYDIPESGCNTSALTRGAGYQRVMRHEIRTALGIDDVPEAEKIKDWGSILLNTTYGDLVEHRLKYVKPALDNIITRIFNNHVPEVVSVQNGIVHDADLYRLCRLTALYTSISFPTSYIRDVVVDSNNGTCIMDDGNTKTVYNKMNNTWSKINPGNRSEQPVEDQLALIMRGFRIR